MCEGRIFVCGIWASMRENLSSEVREQQRHPCSLISTFVVRFLESTISKLVTSEISIF